MLGIQFSGLDKISSAPSLELRHVPKGPEPTFPFSPFPSVVPLAKHMLESTSLLFFIFLKYLYGGIINIL